MNEMIGFWTNWIETVRFACEAQGVIVARLALLASGGPSAAADLGASGPATATGGCC